MTGEERFASSASLLQHRDRNAGRAVAYVIKAGSFTMTLKKPREESDRLMAKQLTFGRSEILPALALDAAIASAGRIRCSLTTPYVVLLPLPSQTLSQVRLPRHLAKEVHISYFKKLLSTVEAFHGLPPGAVDDVIQRAEVLEFPAGEKVITQGQTSDVRMYIVFHGTASATQQGTGGDEEKLVGYLDVGDHFGASNLIENDPHSVRSVSVGAYTDLKVLGIDRQAFGEHLPLVLELLSRELTHRQWLLQYRNKVQLPELEKGRTLGEGTYGSVRLAIHQASGQPYALKKISKFKIISSEVEVQQALNERSLLATSNHPFLLKLVAAYQSKEHLYYLLELVIGGELMTLIQQRRWFDIEMARFYAANTIAAFRYLHSLDIVYRDLKPENVLLEADGYLKIVDFGFGKRVVDRTCTFCGTPDYMAPEILLFLPHSHGADIWSLGILLFEMTVGHAPFSGEDPTATFQRTMAFYAGTGSISWPWFYDRGTKEMVEALLNPDMELRPTAAAAQHSKYFEDINFLELERKQLKPPHVPKVTSAYDMSNFEE